MTESIIQLEPYPRETFKYNINVAFINNYFSYVKYNFAKIFNTDEINQYLDIKKLHSEKRGRHVLLYTNNIFWSIC